MLNTLKWILHLRGRAGIAGAPRHGAYPGALGALRAPDHPRRVPRAGLGGRHQPVAVAPAAALLLGEDRGLARLVRGSRRGHLGGGGGGVHLTKA